MLQCVPGICEHGDGKELYLRPVDQDHLVWQQKQQDPTAMLPGLQLQMCSYNIPVIQVGVREGRLLSVRKFCFVTPNTVSKPQFPQLFLLFRASTALQCLISGSMNKCRAMLR